MPDTQLLVQLRQLLTERFSDNELRIFSSDLGVDYDDLPALGKAAKAHELVGYMYRRGQLVELVRAGRDSRPAAPWPDITATASATVPSTEPGPAGATFTQSAGYDSPGAVLIRPTLTIEYRRDGWYLINKGRGAALNVVVAQKIVEGPERGKWFDPVRVPMVGAGDEVRMSWLGHVNDTGLGASYEDEDGRPFTSLTGNDLTRIVRGIALPSFPEDEIRPHWHFFGGPG